MFNEKEKKEDAVLDVQQTEGKDDIFKMEEIAIEEMAIDGICGVY